jgi:hypothetical protein
LEIDLPENPLEDEPVATPRIDQSETAYFTKLLPRSDALDIFDKFSWSIESLVDHIYISGKKIKLADPT